MTQQVQEIDLEKEYSVSESARITGIHANTIANNIKAGNLHAEKGVFSLRWKIKGSDLQEWLEKR